jgi:secondary thiamine-phosphate synthase enzyme
MKWLKETITVKTHGKGMYDITDTVRTCLRGFGIQEGMCHLYIPHTSASLAINENYDRTARQDMETFMEKLVPENQPWMRHTLEGGDDSSSHLRSILGSNSLSIPIDDGQLSLGTGQGIYLFEHRQFKQIRQVLVRILAVD